MILWIFLENKLYIIFSYKIIKYSFAGLQLVVYNNNIHYQNLQTAKEYHLLQESTITPDNGKIVVAKLNELDM